MSTAKFNHFQVGQNANTDHNFIVTQGADGTGKIERQSGGDIITWDATDKVSFPAGETPVVSKLVSGTPIATTSGTSHDFTGIPSWVKRITVMLNGVSLSATSSILVQIGSGSIDATTYNAGSVISGAGGAAVIGSTSGFPINIGTASYVTSGSMVIALTSGFTWVSSHSLGNTTTTTVGMFGGGTKTLSGTLDRIRLTTVNGTDTFDAGSVNIIYE